MTATIKLNIRKDFTKNDGTSPILLIITIDRKVKRYKTGQFIEPKYWNAKQSEIKSNYTLYMHLNSLLQDKKNKAQSIIIELDKKGKSISFENFEANYFKPDDSFHDFAKDYLKQASIRKSTESKYLGVISKIDKFRPNLTLTDINYNFILDYEKYAISEFSNQTNTIAKDFKFLKSIINVAIKKDKLEKNPFNQYKIKSAPTYRESLTLDEVKKLEEIYEKNEISEKLRNVLVYFLYCCYTGLRYDDIRLHKYNDIVDGNFIQLIMGKTQTTVIIPLIDKAKRLIPKNTGAGTDLIFRVITNEKTNEYLKLIMILAGVKKIISFHCSRHTFATISLNLGIPIEVVSKLLGHTNIKVTEIYAKLLNETKIQQMKKWDNL